jgi:transcriptional regulator ATRX
VADIETIDKAENPTEWWMPLVPEEELLNVEHSGKLLVLLAILEECEAIGDKL